MPKSLFSLLVLLTATAAFAIEPLSDTELDQLVQEFNYPGTYQVITYQQTNSKKKKCWKESLQFSTTYPGNPNGPLLVDAIIYRVNPKKVDNPVRPVVIQLPPMGGTNVLDKWMGGDLCKRKVTSVIVQNDFTNFAPDLPLPTPDDHEESLRRTSAAVKATMKFIEDHQHMDGQKIGIFGVSLGGILGSFTFGLIDEISAGYFLVSGSDIPYILAHSEQDRVVNLRRRRMKQKNIKSATGYESFLRSHFTMDNYDTVRRVPKEATLMRISKKDTEVPTSQQMQLHEGFGKPEVSYSKKGHVGTVIGTLLWKNKRKTIINFFLERFALENPRLPSVVVPPQDEDGTQVQQQAI